MQDMAVWSMLEVAADTVCCTLTALTVLCSCDTYSVADALASLLRGGTAPFLTAVNGLFALCTVVGWYYCGETAFLHLSGNRFRKLFCLTFAAVSASGAVFGTVGALLWMILANRGRIAEISAGRMVMFILFSFYAGFTATGIDNAAHVGGLIFGFVSAMILYRRRTGYEG